MIKYSDYFDVSTSMYVVSATIDCLKAEAAVMENITQELNHRISKIITRIFVQKYADKLIEQINTNELLKEVNNLIVKRILKED